MSDFLDRVAARAIGGEATLAPRLPSLFEPSAHTPILPAVQEDGSATANHATSPAEDTLRAVEPLRPPRATSPRPTDASRLASIEPPAARTLAPVASVPDRATPATARAAPPMPSAPITTRARVPPSESESASAEPAMPLPVQPRQTRTAPPRAEAAPALVGSLLSPSAPVFATPRIAPARERVDHASAIRPRAAPDGGHAAPASEPIVHVSIGRLEVRAAPAAAAPARRRDEPRPASLDDYLRHRGGKASP
jgi:hypothetical protein